MGCTASKLEYEDTVRRCKDRHRLMKDAVYARHLLAAAHSDHCRSLRLTGSALLKFADVFLPKTTTPTPTAITTTIHHPPQLQPPSHIPSPSPSSVHPPPPPFNPSPSPTIASSKPPHILSSSSINSTTNLHHQRRCKQPPPKLPHILSGSSHTSNPRSHSSNNVASKPPSQTTAHSTYSSTPSQTTAYSRQQQQQQQQPQQHHQQQQRYPTTHKGSDSETESEKVDDDDDCSTTTWFDDDDDADDGVEGDVESRSEIGTRSNFGSAAAAAAAGKSEEPGSEGVMEMKMGVRHGDLKEIFDAIKENFDKAAGAGDQVSEMLEINKAQPDRSFRQLGKTGYYHFSSLLGSLSSTWTSKPPLAVKYRLDTGSLDEPGSLKSLCSTLERLLAREKKLYEEVKTREGVKIEHEKKMSALESREYKGEDEAKINETKASVKRLQSQIVFTSEAVSTTSTAITGLRDSDLVPQLAKLCHGMMDMWRSMHQYHKIQSNIVQQVRGLVNRSSGGDSTSELHRQATWDLESAVSAWHSGFIRLIKFQQDFFRSLHGWFKLSLIPVDNNNREPSDADVFFDAWKLALDIVPDTAASEAIKGFINVIHEISSDQAEELKIKKRVETASKELEKKSSSVRNIERKFYNSYSMSGIRLPVPEIAPDNGQGLKARDPLAEKKLELAACQRRVEDEMLRHSKAVEVTRDRTLQNLQAGLSAVFQALMNFSSSFTEDLLPAVRTGSYADTN